LFLERMEIRGLFDAVLSHEDVSQPKPSPEIYRRCLELLGLPPEACLIIEDSVPGIQAARQVTPNVLVVTGPEEVSLELVPAQAEAGGPRVSVATASARAPQPGVQPIEIVIPMAGQGQRFAAKGYDRPKPLIEIFGKPMIQWVVENIRPS